MVEQKLDIIEKGSFKNIDLRKLDNGNHVIVEKLFLECMTKEFKNAQGQSYNFYPTRVKYGEEEVGMSFNKEEDAVAFNEVAGVGDKVKVNMTKEMYQDAKGQDRVARKFFFEKVE